MALDSSDVETAAGAAAPRKVESSQSSSNQKRTAKRKRTVDETAEPAKARRRKRQAVDDEDVDYEKGIRLSYAGMDNNLLADHVAQRTQKHQSDLSTVELEDRRISAGSIRDSSSFALPRTLDNLPTYLEDFAGNTKKLWSASKKNGAPHTIVVTGAGLRAAELARALRKFPTKDAAVAKLFAKHIKIQESIEFLKKHRTGIAVGTPTRLKDLMDDGALSVDKLERIVVDVSHIDQKKRGILDMRETQVPLIEWLNRADLKERFVGEENKIDLLFY